jgi:hypothetical protein
VYRCVHVRVRGLRPRRGRSRRACADARAAAG